MFAINCLPVGSGDYDFHASIKAARKIFPSLDLSPAFQVSEETAKELINDVRLLGIELDAKLDSEGLHLADPSFLMLPNHHILYRKAGLYYLTVWNTSPL